MACDLCGKTGQLYQAKVEGTMMTVCDSCSKYGQVLKRIPSAKEIETASKQKAKKQEEFVAATSLATKSEVMLLVRPDYAKVISAARAKTGIKQEDMAKRLKIKESQLHKYESGTHMPDIETARMLQKELRIKLVTEYNEQAPAERGARGSSSFTLADFVKKR